MSHKKTHNTNQFQNIKTSNSKQNKKKIKQKLNSLSFTP